MPISIEKILSCLLVFFSVHLVWTQSKSSSESSILEQKVDSIMEDAITQRAFPGAQILLYKNNEVRLNKAYGYHTYDSIRRVTKEDLYDLASVTKILAGALAFMKLYELYDIDLDTPLSDYLPFLKRSNKRKSSFTQLLTHSAGWIPSIQHHKTLHKKNGKLKPRTISNKQSKRFPYQIATSLFVHKNYYRTVKRRIKDSELLTIGDYQYSGLWFFLLPELVEQLSRMSIDQFLEHHFYRPLNLKRIAFRAGEKFSSDEIVPTEIDSIFRKNLVHGWVHDEAAALMGRLSTNAGLFANAQSISVLLEMLLNKGIYNDKRYLESETVDLFTSKIFPHTDNRRGLGFDKPILKETGQQTYPSRWTSPSSYGHSGFTGILVWVDPQYDCFMIFLSNRVYPHRELSTIYNLNVRSKVLDQIILN